MPIYIPPLHLLPPKKVLYWLIPLLGYGVSLYAFIGILLAQAQSQAQEVNPWRLADYEKISVVGGAGIIIAWLVRRLQKTQDAYEKSQEEAITQANARADGMKAIISEQDKTMNEMMGTVITQQTIFAKTLDSVTVAMQKICDGMDRIHTSQELLLKEYGEHRKEAQSVRETIERVLIPGSSSGGLRK